MSLQFRWDISLGQVIIGIPVFAMLAVLGRMYGMLLMFRMEHEILMTEWAERNGKKLHELHTRTRRWW